MSKTPVFTGASVAIVTPYTETGVDYPKLTDLIDEQIAAGISAITICGTTGESSTQSLEEHIVTVDFCVKHVAGRVKVAAGTGSNDTEAALMLSLEAEKSGADALLLVTPYYNKTTQRGLVKHYTYIADRVKTPVILYNVPARTGLSFTAETYRELSRHPLINGVKEASGDFSLLAKTIAECGDELNVWSGDDNKVVPMMSLGAKGVISVAANIIPGVMAEMTAACIAGDFAKGAELQLRWLKLIDALFIEVNPIPIKTAMNLMGKNVGNLRMPLCDMEQPNLEKLKVALRGAGLL
ncbi:MAG: 4-hydroxy-tetrahydrodipicolinate synthase [Oscillospiraceae bacterium]|jgi:4-hydroxy-tetrahydrodipicolinate synthase|nr:4-hydroxy-tetrahydrodipicolinate synthase [Oscillospiraceae bacterium]